MAINISGQISDIEQQISDKNRELGTYRDQLNNSPTALGGEGDPTSYDVALQQNLQRTQNEIQALNDKKLKTQWYPNPQTTTPAGETAPAGVIGSTLDFLSRPLYGIVGATKHVTGQGTGTLQQDVADNMVRNKNTFSDVLRTGGMNGSVAAPLGFALDIALDPVNWATMGTGAMVPRMVVGATRGAKTGVGAFRGLSIAAKSSALEKAVTVAKFIPRMKKTEMFANLGESAIDATKNWEKLSGITADTLIGQRGMGVGSYRIGLDRVVNSIADAIPGGKGQDILKTLWYDPKQWVRQSRMKDIMLEQLGGHFEGTKNMEDAILARSKGESIEPFMKELSAQSAEIAQKTPVQPFRINFEDAGGLPLPAEVDAAMAKLSSVGMDARIAEEAPKVVNAVDDAYTIAHNPESVVSGDPIENAIRVANERLGGPTITLEDYTKMIKSGALDATGIKWFDNMAGKIRTYEKTLNVGSKAITLRGQDVIDKYDQAMGIFRFGKVGASPTAFTNAVIGNMVMTHLANGDIGPDFVKTLKLAYNVYHSKPGSVIELVKVLEKAGGDSNTIIRFLNDYQSAARGTFGSLDFLASRMQTEKLLQVGRDEGWLPSSITAEKATQEIEKALGDVRKNFGDVAERNTLVSKLSGLKGAINESTEMHAGTAEALRGITSDGFGVARQTGMLSNEMLMNNSTIKMFDYIAEKAKTEGIEGYAWKLLNVAANKMPSEYEKIDQIFKMTTFLRATTQGYTLNQLRQMRHIVDITHEEIAMGRYTKDGQELFRLSPKTALELSNVMYLNYAAMPAAIRMLRNTPLLGSPFISFMYGMALKTGQTMAYNPAAFNKVSFALNDFSGDKTPLEKKALDTSFYSYLKQPGMYRVPFTDKNPLYLNLSNMIPYYSMNMFNPPQTSYSGGTWREGIAQAAQSSPFMKDPAGSVIFDYLIQPLILGEAIQPQGQFGQPLYPVDAGAMTKLGYGARTLSEAFVPNIAAYAGLATPEAAAPYLPLYRWRALTNAKFGKNQIGISGKESNYSRLFREFMKTSGIPLQPPVNTTFSNKSGQ